MWYLLYIKACENVQYLMFVDGWLWKYLFSSILWHHRGTEAQAQCNRRDSTPTRAAHNSQTHPVRQAGDKRCYRSQNPPEYPGLDPGFPAHARRVEYQNRADILNRAVVPLLSVPAKCQLIITTEWNWDRRKIVASHCFRFLTLGTVL